MSFHVILLLMVAFATFIIAPIALLLTAIGHFRHKASDRPGGGGGLSNAVGGTMLEFDRLLARPSVEHQIETESPVLEAEEDDGE